jgi:hypothetical protein
MKPHTQLSMGPDCSVIDADTGVTYDLADVVQRIPWVSSKVYPEPSMPPHAYVIRERCPAELWEVLAIAILHHPASYLAYFRGYQHPNRYLELPNRRRYWRTWLNKREFLNTCMADRVEPPRRVDQGARPIPADVWKARPWYPQGAGYGPPGGPYVGPGVALANHVAKQLLLEEDAMTSEPLESTVDRPSAEEQAALQAIIDRVPWRACRPEYAAQVGQHEYVVRGKTISEEDWQVLGAAIRQYGIRQKYLVTGNTFTYLLLGEHRYWLIAGPAAGTVLNRAREVDVADQHGPPAKPPAR